MTAATRTEQLSYYGRVTALAEKALRMYETSNRPMESCCREFATDEICWSSIESRAMYLCDTDGMERAERAMGC